MLEIYDLHAAVDGIPILKGIDLVIRSGEIHALMGPNGAGKSSLVKILAGHPGYEVTGGEILFNGASILDKEPEERAVLGMFASFQYPPEIPGVSNREFLFYALNGLKRARGETPLSEEGFEALLDEKMRLIEMRSEFKGRFLNEGFSGGEKKRNEILQMALLQPCFAVLDETDSGLDIDAMRIIARGIHQIRTPESALLLITHYQRLLEYIVPDVIHIVVGGKIVQKGGASLAALLEEKGYAGFVSNA